MESSSPPDSPLLYESGIIILFNYVSFQIIRHFVFRKAKTSYKNNVSMSKDIIDKAGLVHLVLTYGYIALARSQRSFTHVRHGPYVSLLVNGENTEGCLGT